MSESDGLPNLTGSIDTSNIPSSSSEPSNATNTNQTSEPLNSANQTPYNNQGTSEETKNIVTIVLLFLFTPVGIVLMWVWTSWKNSIKWIVSCVACLPVLILAVIFIMSILVNVNPVERINNAKNVNVLMDLDRILMVVKAYYVDNYTYPWDDNGIMDVPPHTGELAKPLGNADWLNVLVESGYITQDEINNYDLNNIYVFTTSPTGYFSVCSMTDTTSSNSTMMPPNTDKYGLATGELVLYCVRF